MSAGTGGRRLYAAIHSLGDHPPNLFLRLAQMAIDKMNIARCGLVLSMNEHLAHERQILAQHNRMARRRVAQVVQPKLVEPRVLGMTTGPLDPSHPRRGRISSHPACAFQRPTAGVLQEPDR